MWWIIAIKDCGVLLLVVFEKNFPTSSDIILHLGISHVDGVGGLGVACWRLVPKFVGSNPAEAVGFLGRKKSSARLPSEGK